MTLTVTCPSCGEARPADSLQRSDVAPPAVIAAVLQAHPAWSPNQPLCEVCLEEGRMAYVEHAVMSGRDAAGENEQMVLESINSRLLLSEDVNHTVAQHRTRAERLAAGVANVVGSWAFPAIIALFLLLWLAFNLGRRPFDPYPMIVVGVISAVLASVAALHGPFIMMAQRSRQKADRTRATNDYRVNLKAEVEIQYLTAQVQQLLRNQAALLNHLEATQTAASHPPQTPASWPSGPQTIPVVGDVPAVDTAQMIEVDRAMIEDYHIDLVRMMENAGRALAHLARLRFLDGDPRGKRVVILAGSGGNGGGALVCARRLANYGADVQVWLTAPAARLTSVPAQQLDILQRMHVPTALADALMVVDTPDLIIDGIIGYSLKGAPRGAAAQLISWANAQNAPIVALDAPSGVDSTSGVVFAPAIQATATLTLALPKRGLLLPAVSPHVGELYLADISVPPALYASAALGLTVNHIFAAGDIVRLR